MTTFPKTPRVLPRAVGTAASKTSQSGERVPNRTSKTVEAPSDTNPAGISLNMSGTQSEPIALFIDLEMEARQCADLDALRFAIVNSTRKIAAFEQAFLAEPSTTVGWCVTRASSVTKIDRQARLVRAIDAWLQHSRHAESLARGEPRLGNLELETKEWGLRSTVFASPYCLWLPIKSRDGRAMAALIALKGENWRPQHSTLMFPLADVYGHAWEALSPRHAAPMERMRSYVSKSRIASAVAITVLVGALIPVPLSVLAPSEIIAAEPMLVTASIEGVVAEILAPPGAWVEVATPIVKFVDVKLRNDVEMAKRNISVAEARYFKVVQSAIATQKDMQELSTAKAELDVASAELEYASDLLSRSEIRAERAGLLIYSAKSDWLGKPVALGERLMEIADPRKTEIKIDLPVSDAIALQEGGRVSMFLDGDPLRSIAGTITRTSYRPTLTTEQQLAFRIHARFDDGKPRRIGLRGVARVNGQSVSLWFYLLRRPISALRQKAGL